MKITVYNGPIEEFEKILPKEDTTTLTPLIRIMDLMSRGLPTLTEIKSSYDVLVVYTDEYSGVADHFIEGFLINLMYLSEAFFFKEVYLHNPPIRILHQVENPNSGITYQKIDYKHKKLTISSLKKIKKDFDSIVFGQEKVKNEILNTLYSLTNKGNHKPVVIMLYGPAGVGKTETAKLINQIISEGSELFRKQLSMFHNESFSSYIFGDKTNSLSKDLIDRKTNVILLDEFDKAHPMFYSAFYQMFDEGKIVDKYYEVNLKNTIIICTSNYSSENEIQQALGPAIFSRFDNFIKFIPLSNEAKINIIKTTYKKEILNFNRKDREYLQNENIEDIMINYVYKFQNAREIQKTLKRLLAYPLISKL